MNQNITKQQPLLYYFHDPMCSWCYGFKNSFETLCDQLDNEVTVKRILGGLAPDSTVAMPDAMREQIKQNWRQIESTIPGVTFNFNFWQQCQPRRSTYASCRAVIAARQQGDKYDELMTQAIQKAYYQQARNPSDDLTLIEIAEEIGLDQKVFLDEFYSEKIAGILQQEVELARSMFVESFPSLILAIDEDSYTINIDYNDYQVMLDQIKEKIHAVN